jgi:predicted RNA-binding protein YlqC (UPF0109 family)
MSEIDQQFIEYVVKSLVGKPDAVQVKRTIDEKGVLLELTVDPDDLGRVIGKRGATAQSLRTLLRALGTKNDARYNLKIVDNGVEKPARAEAKAEEPATAETAAEKEPEVEATDDTTEEAATDEDSTTSRLAETRKELADLDDLDV